MTYSIGFRAPSRAELIGGWCDELVAGLGDDDRYEDPGLLAQANPGEISAEALAKLHALVTGKLADRAAFARWFGEYTTTRKYPDMDWAPEEPLELEEFRALLAQGMPLIRNPASRFSFIRGEAGAVALFVDGEWFECAGEMAGFAEMLCAGERCSGGADLLKSDAAMEMIVSLFNQGSVAFEVED